MQSFAKFYKCIVIRLLVVSVVCSCTSSVNKSDRLDTSVSTSPKNIKYLSEPLITGIYTADPSAHVFNGKIYIYPSHDIDAGIPENDNGDHFAMKDYHILSMDSIGGKLTDNGVGLEVKNIPWAGRQLWAPDAAFKNGTYYLYFPVKDKQDIFRIGVATSSKPTGPFKAETEPIPGSFSIDPAVFTDTDGKSYMYFGGIWGGQLQRWTNGKYNKNGSSTDSKIENDPAISCKVGILAADMKHINGQVKDVMVLDSLDKPLLTKDHNRRFFEGSWMHKFKDKYYFTYSTGDTHLLCCAVGSSPLGPFRYKGVFMNPVQGWTTHHSIVEIKGKWFLFYHDTQISDKTWLRNIKVTPLEHRSDGTIQLINPYRKM